MVLQEAAYICQGSAASVMGMASEEQNDLWEAVTKVCACQPLSVFKQNEQSMAITQAVGA